METKESEEIAYKNPDERCKFPYDNRLRRYCFFYFMVKTNELDKEVLEEIWCNNCHMWEDSHNYDLGGSC